MSIVGRGDVDFNRGLFEELRSLRRQLAAMRGVNPDTLFHDSTLQEMAHYIPQSRRNLSRISGVGDVELEQFGEEFLSVICIYARKHRLAERIKPAYSIEEIRREYPKAYAKWSSDDDERLKEMYAAGNDVAELAKHFERGTGAIESRLRKLGLMGVTLSRLKPSAHDQSVGYASTFEMQNRQRVTLQEEPLDYVLDSVGRMNFIGKDLEPYADVPGVSKYLRYLEQINESGWMRPAGVFHRHNLQNPEKFLRFFQDLERLAYAMFILQVSIDQRMTRYTAILHGIEQKEDLFPPSSPLQISAKEKKDILSTLDGPIYSPTPVCKPLLLRLDSLLAEAGVRYDHPTITIEHILPRNPERNSQWLRDFPDEKERIEWTDRLANLVLLPHIKNSSAQNYDFNHKKEVFFQKGKTVTFALTAELQYVSKWTPEVLERRQKRLLDVLKREWRLGRETTPRPMDLSLGRGVIAESTLDQTRQLVEQGLSVEKIASERGLTQSTIFSHLKLLIEIGVDIDLRPMLPAPERVAEIRTAFKRTGGSSWKPVKEVLGDDYTYEEIRMVWLVLRREGELPG